MIWASFDESCDEAYAIFDAKNLIQEVDDGEKGQLPLFAEPVGHAVLGTYTGSHIEPEHEAEKRTSPVGLCAGAPSLDDAFDDQRHRRVTVQLERRLVITGMV